MVENYFINDPSKIVEIQFQRIRTYNHGTLRTLDRWYLEDPIYYKVIRECIEAKNKPSRHQIVQSEDINSCFRYISFNRTNKTLYVSAHFRSQNNYTEKDDFAFICKCITNYMEDLEGAKDLDFSINVYVDEFLILVNLD